jgi:hypothetical protein
MRGQARLCPHIEYATVFVVETKYFGHQLACPFSPFNFYSSNGTFIYLFIYYNYNPLPCHVIDRNYKNFQGVIFDQFFYETNTKSTATAT